MFELTRISFFFFSEVIFEQRSFFKLNLVGCHWLTKLYRFHVYSSTAHHLYSVLVFTTPSQVSVQHHLSPLYPAPHPSNFLSPQHYHTVVCVHEFFLLFPFCSVPPHTPLRVPPDSCQPALYL